MFTMATSSVRIILMLSFLSLSLALVCETGWFGLQCQYQCHCSDNRCTADGLCESDSQCVKGWFGPACQYADLATTYDIVDRDPSYETITDGDDSTCVHETTTELSVKFSKPFQFTWLRLHFHARNSHNDVDVQFESEGQLLECRNRKVITTSKTSADIHCDLDMLVKQVILSGPGMQYVCSLYISGGRNVALRESTRQSSEFAQFNIWRNSSLAVDGNTNGDFFKNSCTHTGLYDTKPTWDLIFTHNVTLNRFILYNRIDQRGILMHRLQGFLLRVFNQANEEVVTIRDNTSTAQPVYIVQLTNPIANVATVNVEATTTDGFQGVKRFLTVCEFQAFGDSICDSGLFGRNCEHECHCADRSEQCAVSNGGCTSGCDAEFRGEGCQQQKCKTGWFGSRCQFQCHCSDNKCNDDGSCENDCAKEWFGPACQYANLAESDTVDNGDPSYEIIIDGDESTCLDESTSQVTAEIAFPFQFTWLRLHARDRASVNNFDIQFKSEEGLGLQCLNRKTSVVSDTTVDIHCDVETLVTEVILSGQGVQSLCSLYISGGRNLALGEITSQSSNYIENSISRNSSLAIDGNTDGKFIKNSCSQTAVGDPKPNWNLTFLTQVTLNRFLLYNMINKKGRLMSQLQGFILRGFNQNDEEVINIRDDTSAPQFVYVVQLKEPISNIETINVEATKTDRHGRNKALTLCEFQAFGEYVCPLGFWGQECIYRCNCAVRNEACFVSTGGCPSG